MQLNQEDYRILAENLPGIVYRVFAQENWHMHFFNNMLEQMTGYRPEELVHGQVCSIDSLIVPEERTRVTQTVQSAIDGHHPFEVEYHLKRKDLSIHNFFERGRPIYDARGELVYIDGVIFDTTEHKLAEERLRSYQERLELLVEERTVELRQINRKLQKEMTEREKVELALRESKARYRAIVDGQTELVSRFLPDFTITFVNDAYCNYFGQKGEELIGGNFWHLVPSQYRNKLKKHFASLTPQNPLATITHRYVKPDGEVRWQHWIDRAIYDNQGNLREFQSVARDITEHKQVEEALKESQNQLRFLSSNLLKFQEEERIRLARSLHDNIGQILAAIKLAAERTLITAKKEKCDPVVDSLAHLIEVVRGAIETVRDLYMELRPSILDDFGIETAINWLCKKFQQSHKNVRIEKEIHIDRTVRPESLETAIFRIVEEALDNAEKHSDASKIKVYLAEIKGRMELSITDNGTGFDVDRIMSGDVWDKGLGIASMRQRVESVGGSLRIESTPGKGTTIRVSWP